MLRDRGYSVPASEIDLSLQDFRFLHGPTPYIGRLRFSTTHCTDPSDRMLVIYCGPGIVKVNVIRGLHSQIKDTLAGLILITQNQVTNQALKTLELYLFKTEIFRGLGSNVVSSAQVLANVANLLNIRDIELSSFLVAMGDISLRKTGVEEKRAKVQKESNVLLDYTRKAISRLTYLKRTLAQLEDDGSQSMLSIGRTIWF
ncbi:hypothetical protein EV1_009133 [Malus domestica]